MYPSCALYVGVDRNVHTDCDCEYGLCRRLGCGRPGLGFEHDSCLGLWRRQIMVLPVLTDCSSVDGFTRVWRIDRLWMFSPFSTALPGDKLLHSL